MFKATEYLILISGEDIWSAAAVTEEQIGSKSIRVSKLRNDGSREVGEILEDNGDFPEFLSKLIEIDKIHVPVEILCENEHFQTNINSA